MLGNARGFVTAPLWVVVWLLILAGLTTAVVTSIDETPNPEVIIETCSLLAALLLVIVDRISNRVSARSALLNGVIDEMAANAAKLRADIWRKDEGTLRAEAEDVNFGLRFYYPHLSTSAISAAVLSTHFDVDDFALVQKLNRWQSAVEECNARLSMGQHLLFFLPPNEKGMSERLSLHLSICAVPVARAKEALLEVGGYLQDFNEIPISRVSRAHLTDIDTTLAPRRS